MKVEQHECHLCQTKDKSVFCQLDSDELKDVSQHKTMYLYQKGEVVFHEGTPGLGVYCVSEGKVKLTKMTSEGKESIIRISGPGDLLGFQNITEIGVCDVTATALEKVKICFLDKQYMSELIKSEGTVALELISHISKDMLSLQEKFSGHHHKNVRERVALLLLEFVEKYGQPHPQGKKINLILSREELSNIVGVATETLIRMMSELKDEKIIAQEGKSIIIQDLAKLKHFAGIGI